MAELLKDPQSLQYVGYYVLHVLSNEWWPCQNREPNGEIHELTQSVKVDASAPVEQMREAVNELLHRIRLEGFRRFIKQPPDGDGFCVTDENSGVSLYLRPVIESSELICCISVIGQS